MWVKASAQREEHGGSRPGGLLLLGDVATANLEAYNGRVQCVYLDPPFGTGGEFEHRMRIGAQGWRDSSRQLVLPAYSDRFPQGKAQFLLMLRAALEKAYDLLADTGALFLHLDSRMNASARLECDRIFGEGNFVNEIVWAYQSGGRSRSHFSRKHDTILFYAKSRALKFYIDRVAIPRKNGRQNHMKRTVDAQGRPCRTITSGGKVYTYYDDAPALPDDVWTDVSHLQQKDPQRTGYDTQKPLALLDRIIRCCTEPGDLVADLFCGSGTTLVSAQANGCRYLGLDASPQAVSVSRKCLLDSRLLLEAPFDTPQAELQAEVYQGIGYYEVHLKSYTRPEEDFAHCLRRPADLRLEGMDVVDQWSAGFLREGVFKVFASSARKKQTPEIDLTLSIPLLRGDVAVEVVDVLGSRTLWKYQQEPGQNN